MADFEKFDFIDPIEYYKAVNTESSLQQGIWNVNTSKRHAFKIFSDRDILEEHEEKILIPPVTQETSSIVTFSSQIDKIFKDTKIVVDDSGSESVVLTLDNRVVTIILDQSGSMTWNDNNKFRHTLASEIVEKIDENYPGEIKYNILDYGGVLVDLLFFAVIDDGSVDVSDLNTLTKLLFADRDANFAGVRVIRNPDRYPESVADGEEVADGLFSKAFDEGLTEGEDYYYTVFTYDENLKFSQGTNIKVTPREREIPRGVSTFRSWVPSSEISVGEVFKGSGVVRDENVVGLWHLNEGDGKFAWDFSETGANIEFEKEPDWLPSALSPSGESGLRFDGNVLGTSSPTSADTSSLELSAGTSLTIMAWIFPYDLSSSQDNIVMSLQGDVNNIALNWYVFIASSGAISLVVPLPSGASITDISQVLAVSTGTVTENQWNHIAITIDGTKDFDPSFQSGGNINFYINGDEAGFSDMELNREFRPSQQFTIGGIIVPASFGGTEYKYYGKISEISVHNVARDAVYIAAQVKSSDVLNESGGVVGTQATGVEGDNGDRLAVLQYEIPQDYNFPGGKVRVVRKEKEPPSWEEDGEVIHEKTINESGITYLTDPDDFVHKEDYYYRMFSQNILGNYSFLTDSPLLKFAIPESSNEFFPELTPDLPIPEAPEIGQLITPGNKKIYIRWNNNVGEDNRVLRTRIFYSPSDYPVVSDSGGSNGQLVFSGLLDEEKFVHRELINDREAYYSIVNTDKYGRASPVLTASTIPSLNASEDTFPLPEVVNLHYELFNRTSVTLAWDQSVSKNPENINTYFDETVIIYASITDQFGAAISDESQVTMEISPLVARATGVDDVFGTGADISFDDADVFDFLISKDDKGIIRGTLNITNNPAIVSQIESVSFDVKIKSFISSPDGNLFEYVSRSIKINFTNPWEIELVNRDDLKVRERCYFIQESVTDEGKEVQSLRVSSQGFNGIHIRKSSPFVARAKLTFKGDPILAGSIDVAVWDAEEELCTCAGSDNINCEYKGRKVRVSETVLPPSATLPIIRGFEDAVDADGNPMLKEISFVDIPLLPPDLPQAVLLFVKGTHASFSTIKDIYIVFQNILQIDINANAPKINGHDVVEQQATAFLINPDHPEDQSLRTVPDDLTVVQWEILPISSNNEDEANRTIFSIDNVAIPNGVFSFLRSGTARNVFFGPIAGEEDDIEETLEIRSTIVYNGLTSTARQFVNLAYSPKTLPQFGARFLMETEYYFKSAKVGRTWTDGEDFVRLFISRDPRTSTTKHAGIFRDCAAEEDAPLLELNPSGQVVHLTNRIVSSISSPDGLGFVEVSESSDEVEFIWGDDIIDDIDPYTGEEFIIIGEDATISKEEAFVQLNSEEISDTTTVYVRINKFTPDAKGWKTDPECDETQQVNLKCLELNKCDMPGEDMSIYGTTTLFVNDEPFELRGGGSMTTGIIPCPITFKEPLRFKTIYTRIDGVDTPFTGQFIDDEGNSLLTPSSAVDIRVEVSFAGKPVPDGTFVYLVVSNDTGEPTVFIGSANIVSTFTEGGKSYADLRVVATRNPDEQVGETVRVITRYNKVGNTARERVETFYLQLDHEDIKTPGDIIEVEEPSVPIPAEDFNIFSNTIYKYDVLEDGWELVQSMSEGKGSVFGGSYANDLYVFGGLKSNIFEISSIGEKYDVSSDVWSIVSAMPTPRFGGSSITVGNNIYTIGGVRFNEDNQTIEVSNVVEVYDADTDIWTTLSPMPVINEDTVSEISYGVAFGTAQKVDINHRDYIYILSGISEIDTSRGDPIISRYNDRVLRYDIEADTWEYTRTMYSSEIGEYSRVSPLSFINDDKIYVVNGALNNEREYEFHKDIYKIYLAEEIDSFIYEEGSREFSQLPIAKFQSSIAPVDAENPSAGGSFYIIGGASEDDKDMDTIEWVETLSQPFAYLRNSDIDDPSASLTPMPIGKSGIISLLGYIGSDPNIYVVGGFTSGNDPNQVIINFDI
tara:strand:+ start:14241 stop:20195 length:5955 start_codon:yes stop_codon:yes gene_type:complete